MAVFQTPTDQEGFYVPDPGNYVGESIGIEPFEGKFGASVKWNWKLFGMDGTTEVMDEGDQAVVDALSSAKVGPRTKTRKWLGAHLGREIVAGEDPDALQAQLPGKRVMLIYGPNEDGDCRLLQVLPFQG